MADQTKFDVLDLLNPLRRYARSLTRSDSYAEDLVHDAVVRAYERQHTFRRTAISGPGFSRSSIIFSSTNGGARTPKRGSSPRSPNLCAERPRLDQESALRLKQIMERFSRFRISSAQRCTSSRSRACLIRKRPRRSASRRHADVASVAGARRHTLLRGEGGKPRPTLRIVGGTDE